MIPLVFILGAIFGVLVVVTAIKSILYTGRFAWKWASVLLLLFVVAAVLALLHFNTQTKMQAMWRPEQSQQQY